MDIADYIPSYPELNGPDFNESILEKKEFYDLRTTDKPDTSQEPGDLWNHQRLIARFVSPYTPYSEQVLYHTPGTGKTCAAIAVAEVNKQDPLVRKPILIAVPNDTLVSQWKQQIALICTAGQYVPENYFSLDPVNKLTAAEKTTRINKLIAPVYTITTIERLRRHIDKIKSDDVLRLRYSNTIIIIDEAHNLRIQTNVSKEEAQDSKSRYKTFHRFFHVVENSKKLLLSGTPMVDRANELPGLMNLLLPINEQMPTGAQFTKKFLKTVPGKNIRQVINQEELFGYLVGKVSYIREGGNFPTRIDLGEPKWTEYIKTVNPEMSETQLAGYGEAFEKDTATGEKATGLWKNSRQAATFVYEHDGQYLWDTAASKLLLKKGKPKKLTLDGRDMTDISTFIASEYVEDIKNNLGKYSAKFKHIVDYIEKHPNDPIYIFTPLVRGAGGAIFLGAILRLFGYAKALGSTTTPGKRYAIITGEDKSNIQRKKLIEIFNSDENRNGEIIHVMIGTKTIAEGTSFINVKQTIVVSPYWNNSVTEQAIGRAFRATSLSYLPPDERIVEVQQLAVDSEGLDAESNIDARLYQLSERKDLDIKVIERILKKVSWDCALNYSRNVRDNDIDYTRSCDYQLCNYVCYQTNPKKTLPKYDYSIPEEELHEDTWLLYYSYPKMIELTKRIGAVLRTTPIMDIDRLYDYLELDSFKLLVLALEYMVENHVTVYNKWGQPGFLLRDGNLLFISDTPASSSSIVSWYARYPYANKFTPLMSVINDEIYARDLQLFQQIDLSDPEEAKELINQLDLSTQIFILEYLLSVDSEEAKDRLDLFLDIFSDHIFTIEGTVVHNLEKTKPIGNYVDATKGEFGNLRCFRDGRWEDCTKKESEILSKEIATIKESAQEDIIKNPLGIYAIITGNSFKIADKSKEKKLAKDDRRKVFKGKVCNQGGWKKWQLIELFLRLNIDSEADTSLNKKDELIQRLTKLKVVNAIPKKPTVSQLQKILGLAKMGNDEICGLLKEWFISNDLVIYE